MKYAFYIAALLLSVVPNLYSSLMLGESLQVTRRYQNTNNILQTWNVTVGSGTEIYDGAVQIDITDTSIRFISSGATGFTPYDFNGYVLSDSLSILPNFDTVTGPDSFMSEGRVTVEENDIFIDFGGRGITNGGWLEFSVSVIPEPSTFSLFSLSFILMLWARKKLPNKCIHSIADSVGSE
jgi:hypothetical protein